MGITIGHRVRRGIREAAREIPRRFFMETKRRRCSGREETTLTTTMNDELRQKMLEPYYYEKAAGGLRYFSNLPLDVLENLIQQGFVEMEPWNTCDGVEQLFLPFLRRNPQFKAHGYAVMPERPDQRVTIEGVERHDVLTMDEIIDFATTFRCADEMELEADFARCWYD